MDDLLISFTEFLLHFREVKRTIRIPKTENERENDAEHSYHLAMICWYLLDLLEITDLDKTKVLQMALAHDLVEVYAGDTFFFADKAVREQKKEREAQAAQKIGQKFPQFPTLHSTIIEYEKLESEEACFVYAVDKLVPILMIWHDEGRTWKEKGITFQKEAEAKFPLFALSPKVQQVAQQLIKKLEERPELFATS